MSKKELSPEAKAARNNYYKEYRKRNPDKVLKNKEYSKEWRRRNPEKVRLNNRIYWERLAAKSSIIKTDNESVTSNIIAVTNSELPVTKPNLSVTSLNDAIAISKTNNDARCINCGEIFYPKRSDAKFCSTRCRVQFNRTIKGY